MTAPLSADKALTEEMLDSVRGVLQILRNTHGATYAAVRTHCSMRGDDLSRWPAWIADETGYVTEAGAARMIFEIMERFGPRTAEPLRIAGPNSLWVVWYEDAQMKPEVFFGEGAEAAARERFRVAEDNWSCHLLARICTPVYGSCRLVSPHYGQQHDASTPPSAVTDRSQSPSYDDLLAALKRAREGLYNGFEPDNQSRCYRDIDDVIKAVGLARLTRSETAFDEWIPVADGQLPRDTNGGEVLAWTITGHGMATAPSRIRSLHAEARTNGEDCFYTHWMPMPKGPK